MWIIKIEPKVQFAQYSHFFPRLKKNHLYIKKIAIKNKFFDVSSYEYKKIRFKNSIFNDFITSLFYKSLVKKNILIFCLL